MKSGSRAVCLRFGPQTAGSGVNAPWSHPDPSLGGLTAIWSYLCSHLSLLKQLGQVTFRLTSACAVDATASALYILQAFNASQHVCPHVHDANMSQPLTRDSAACHSSLNLVMLWTRSCEV